MTLIKCQYCGKECKNNNSLAQHEIRCKLNPNKIILPPSNFINYNKSEERKNKQQVNQYTKAKREGYEINISDETRKKIGNGWRGKTLPEEMKQKISEGMKEAVKKYPDSYSSTNVNGRVKHYEINGITLDGKWELTVAIYLNSQHIKWERPRKGFEYLWNNSTHIYYPDFYLPDFDYYIEVKGYERSRDYFKWNSVKNLIIIKQKEIQKIQEKKYNIIEEINNKDRG
jgi:hypothetical protein